MKTRLPPMKEARPAYALINVPVTAEMTVISFRIMLTVFLIEDIVSYNLQILIQKPV